MARSDHDTPEPGLDHFGTSDESEGSVGEIDWSRPGVRLEFDPEVERPTRPVTLRLPRRLLQELRVLAEKVAEMRRQAS